MFIEPTITWVLSGFSGYIWLDKKCVERKIAYLRRPCHLMFPCNVYICGSSERGMEFPILSSAKNEKADYLCKLTVVAY